MPVDNSLQAKCPDNISYMIAYPWGLTWLFPGAALKINVTSGNSKDNLTARDRLNTIMMYYSSYMVTVEIIVMLLLIGHLALLGFTFLFMDSIFCNVPDSLMGHLHTCHIWWRELQLTSTSNFQLHVAVSLWNILLFWMFISIICLTRELN